MSRTLDVYLNAELSGSLSQNGAQEMTFTYSPSATRSISIGMPYFIEALRNPDFKRQLGRATSCLCPD
jgi:hypothetical protein